MRAIILIGGQGTRLRPLTLDVPKPLLPIGNRPFLVHQLELLRRHGVRDVTLASGYKTESFKKALGDGRRFGVRLRYAHERSPLGTGGAILHAARREPGTTVVLNGDVLAAFDLRRFFDEHRRAGAVASIALVPVSDPTRYGVIETVSGGRIVSFVEKPRREEVTAYTINAGAYLLEPGVFDAIPTGRPVSVERETFPELLLGGAVLHGFLHKGYWLDIGNIESYLQANRDAVSGLAPFRPSGRRRGGAVLAPGAKLGRGARLTGMVVVGRGCEVGEEAALEDCVLLEGARVGARAVLSGSVLGRGAEVGADAALSGASLGAAAWLPPFSRVLA